MVSEWEESGDISIELDPGQLLQHDYKDGNMDLRSVSALEPETWYSAALTFNGETGEKAIYINGELDTEGVGEAIPLNFDTFTIGGFIFGDTDPTAAQRLFAGYLDDSVRLSSVRRTDKKCYD